MTDFLSSQKLTAAMFSQKKSIIKVLTANILMEIYLIKVSVTVFCRNRNTCPSHNIIVLDYSTYNERRSASETAIEFCLLSF